MELSQCKERLDAWFSDKEPEMLSMLERIVNMDSFTNDAADVNKVGGVVTGWLAEAGFHTAKLPKKPAPADEQWMNGLGITVPSFLHKLYNALAIQFSFFFYMIHTSFGTFFAKRSKSRQALVSFA